jgi:hypothetical protein
MSQNSKRGRVSGMINIKNIEISGVYYCIAGWPQLREFGIFEE